jgi:hypothetical protein
MGSKVSMVLRSAVVLPLPQMFRRLRPEASLPRLKAFDSAAATGVPVSDVKGSPAIRTRKAYYAAGKELLTYAGET